MDKAPPSLPVTGSRSSGSPPSIDDNDNDGERQRINPSERNPTITVTAAGTPSEPRERNDHRGSLSGASNSGIDEDGNISATSNGSSSKTTARSRSRSGSNRSSNGSGGGNNATGSGGPQRIRRRNRMITSCLECRRRKLKCDRLHPCTNCAKFKRDCVFLAPALDSKSKKKLAELKEKMGSLERVLEFDVAGKGGGSDKGSENGGGANREGGYNRGEAGEENEYEDEPVPEDEAHLEPTRMAVQDAAYEGEADDDTVDLGVRLGKMRLTDRIGGLFRPRISDEITESLEKLPGHGKAPGEQSPVPKPPRLRDLLQTEKDAYFNPGPSYIAPRSELFFGTETVRKYTLFDFLPSKFAADNLLQRYWESVHPVAKVVHRQSFEKRYRSFWEDASRGFEPSPSLQALVFAAMFSAVTSMTDQTVLSTFGVPQKNLIENFQLGTEMALGKAHFLRTTKTETLQALVMYIIPMCRAEISRTHSTLVGAAIRLAECMGFHRDPSEYGLGAIETHVRRMIWYQLCFLDMRTGESQGPRPTIRREDFSTRFPLNVDDSDLEKPNADSLQDMSHWTDMTYTRISMECFEFHRVLYHENKRLVKKSVSLTHVLGKIEAFRKSCYAKYGPLVNGANQKPVQRAAGLVLSILVSRMYIGVLHRYYNSVSVRIPDRLRQIIITTGTQLLENSIELETSPDLQPWSWYSGTYQQYHTAFLLLFEVFLYPMRRESERIWRCLDYIFEVPPFPFQPGSDPNRVITRKDLIEHRARKSTQILTQIRDRMSAYQTMRKVRIPVQMRDTSFYMRSQGSGAGNDLMTNKPENIQEAGQTKNDAGNLVQTQATYTQPTKPASQEGEKLPFTGFLSSSFDSSSYPTYPTHQHSPQNLSPNQPLSYAQPQSQTPPQYQFNLQSNRQSYPPWQPQPRHSGTSSQDFNYGTQPSGYGQDTFNAKEQSLGSDTISSEDSSGAGIWFNSSIETTGGGTGPSTHPPAPPEDATMLDIDWNEWDKLFPPELNTGDLNLPPSMEEQAIPMDTSFDVFSSTNFELFPQQ
ncbi:hypothetical protein FQN54_007798 [Arachnomyces sp. PD_36]|nr:hypothetical protein FQN54_007798 [Arachnomyces sp. PD_36]